MNERESTEQLSAESPAWDPADYAANAMAQRGWARELIGRLALSGHERVLDVGCGDGGVTAELAAELPEGSVLGVDASAAMVAHARRTHPTGAHPNLAFEVMDARQITVAEPVDVVFSNAALHWVDDHPAFLRGAANALRVGGRLVVSCGGRGNAEAVFRSVRTVMRDARWRAGFKRLARPYHFFGPEDYRRWLPEAGLAPRLVQLTPREMVQPTWDAFAGWIRTTWIPYTHRVPSALRDEFVAAVVAHYLRSHPPDAEGCVRARMVRLEIVAEKTQGCIKLPLLSLRGTSGERIEERGSQEKRASSPRPSPPSDGGEGENEELDAALENPRGRQTAGHAGWPSLGFETLSAVFEV